MREILFHNGNVITIDGKRPKARSVLTADGRITYVGDDREARSRAGRDATLVDLDGRTLIPGFNDNHIHTLVMGDTFSQPKLHGMTLGQIVRHLEQVYAHTAPGELVTAMGWDYPTCPDPHRSALDAAFPDNPVVLVQFSGHGAWLNSRALDRFHIDRNTPDPPGGQILRDADGEPTGVLRDTAVRPIHRARFKSLRSDRRRAEELLELSLEAFREAGITSVQDNTWFPSTVGLLGRLRRRNRLTTRFSCWFYGMIPAVALLMELRRFDRDWFSRGPWKFFLDGTFSTKTAWLKQPYSGEPDNRGFPGELFDSLDRILARAAVFRRRAAFHAIGDRTIHEFLNAVERTGRRHPQIRDLRLRLEHAQLIDPGDIPRLRELGVLVAAQPSSMGNPKKDAGLLGDERSRRAYPYRSLLDAGVPLSFGSDMPGEPTYDPLLSISYASSREGPERITPLEALTAYTLGSAYAEREEERKGSIEPGKLADMAVLTDDPLSTPPERIRDIRVAMTVVAGDIVHCSNRHFPCTMAGVGDRGSRPQPCSGV